MKKILWAAIAVFSYLAQAQAQESITGYGPYHFGMSRQEVIAVNPKITVLDKCGTYLFMHNDCLELAEGHQSTQFRFSKTDDKLELIVLQQEILESQKGCGSKSHDVFESLKKRYATFEYAGDPKIGFHSWKAPDQSAVSLSFLCLKDDSGAITVNYWKKLS